MKDLFSWRSIAITGATAVFGLLATASPALASGPTDPSQCTAPSVSQAFLSLKDQNWYSLAPGQTFDNFDASGWTLSGKASVVSTTLADGTTGNALNLPSGSTAISPNICVSSNYPTTRTYVRDLVGGEGVQFYVSYENADGTWTSFKNTGQFHSQAGVWSVSDPNNLQPPTSNGWELLRIKFVPGGTTSDFQVSNFYIDPRCRR